MGVKIETYFSILPLKLTSNSIIFLYKKSKIFIKHPIFKVNDEGL